jgi:hypothetical protein
LGDDVCALRNSFEQCCCCGHAGRKEAGFHTFFERCDCFLGLPKRGVAVALIVFFQQGHIIFIAGKCGGEMNRRNDGTGVHVSCAQSMGGDGFGVELVVAHG